MPDPITILMAHVARTLPKDPVERRALLVAMKSQMTAKHPAWTAINRHIDYIDAQIALERDVQMTFDQLLKGLAS